MHYVILKKVGGTESALQFKRMVIVSTHILPEEDVVDVGDIEIIIKEVVNQVSCMFHMADFLPRILIVKLLYYPAKLGLTIRSLGNMCLCTTKRASGLPIFWKGV